MASRLALRTGMVLIALVGSALVYSKKSNSFSGSQAINLGPTLNTSAKEAMPCISGNGRVIIFQSNRIVGGDEALEGGTGEENWDLWVSYRTDSGEFTAPAILEGVNSDYFDGHASLSANGQRLYFSSNRPDGGQDMNIWFTHLRDGEWSKPRKLSKVINSPGLETFPSIGPDDNTLYFTRKDGIYMSRRGKYNWQKPQKLPRRVNAGYEEAAPAIHVDGRTLYFSSKRPGGQGGYDLYLSRKKRKNWSKAINLGPSINGIGNDLFASIPASGKMLYFASVRPGGYGGEDLYKVPLPPHLGPEGVTLVSGKVFHTASKKPVRAKIEIYDIRRKKVIDSKFTSKDGRYSFILNARQRYGVTVSAGGFYFLSANFDLVDEKYYREIKHDFGMVALGQPGVITLGNIFFRSGSARLLPDSRYELNRLARLLKTNSTVHLEIGGHTDSRGGKAYSKRLSQQRAEAVLAFLVKQGISRQRLTAVGYGDEKPVASNASAEGRRQNRRTEFKILK